MKESRSYAREKMKIQDRCNICGKTSDLTWDHVPPKFCFNSERAKYNSLLEINKEDTYCSKWNNI